MCTISIGGSKGGGGGRGGGTGMHPPVPEFFRFHAVFGKIWQNCMLVPLLGELAPSLGEILDLPLISISYTLSLIWYTEQIQKETSHQHTRWPLDWHT